MGKTIISLVALQCLLVHGAVCRARPILVKISAEVTAVKDESGLLEGVISIGDRVEGTYQYDTSSPNLLSWGNMGRYQFFSSPFGVILQVGKFVFQTDPNHILTSP